MKIFVLIVEALWFILCAFFVVKNRINTPKKYRDERDGFFESILAVWALLSLAAFIFTIVGWK